MGPARSSTRRCLEIAVPEPAADMLVGLFAASRRGGFAAVDPTLEHLLGRPPLTVRDVLAGRRA